MGLKRKNASPLVSGVRRKTRSTVPPCLRDVSRRFVTAVTGGPVPVVPGGSGAVGFAFPAGRFHHARPSLSGSGGPFSVIVDFGDSVSPGKGFVKRGKRGFSPGIDKSPNACYNFGETPQGTASGQLRYPERGCFHADYFDLSREGIHRDDHCKTQKPPLGKVTVS